MFLTRFRVNTARTQARRLLSSPQSTHAAVMSAFPDLLPTDTDTPRVLWRLDRAAPAQVHLFIASPTRPDLTHLVEQAGWPAVATDQARGWTTYDYAPFLAGLDKGSTWNFRLTANPVHSVRNRDGVPTKRTAHLTARHQVAWLLQRQEAGGFHVIEKPADKQHAEFSDTHQVAVSDQRTLDFPKRGAKGRVIVKTVTYDGRLEITDPDALRRLLTTGLGKAKAYGCGLMTLAPAGER